MALTVLFSVLLLLGHTLLLGFASVSFGRQRATATQLANQAVEEVRSLAPTQWLMGQTDLAGGTDPAVTPGCGGAGQYCFRGRHIRVASVTGPDPLVPHLVALPPAAGTVYTRAVYVTDDPSGNPDAALLTVLVSWSQPGINGVTPAVQVETTLDAAASAPPAAGDGWSAAAAAKPGSVLVTGSVAGTGGVDLREDLGTVSTSLSSGQGPTTVVADAAAPAASALVGGTPVSSGGGASAQASAPAAGDPDDGGLAHNGTPGPVSLTGSQGPVDVTLSSALGSDSTAGAYAATQADGATPAMGPPASDTDNLEWGRSVAAQSGDVTTSVAIGGVPLLSSANFPLVNVLPPATADQAEVNRDAASGATGTGSVTHSLGTVSVLSLPGGVSGPAGWTGSLLSLSGYSATATAVAGPGAAATDTSAASSGTVTFWNGSGYSSLPLSASGATVPVAPVSVAVGSCSISLGASVTTGGWTSSTTAQAGGGIATASADVPSPIAGTFSLQIACPGLSIADLSFTLDLGDTSAQAASS